MTTFACERADVASQLTVDLRATLQAEGLTGIYEDYELALLPAL